MVETDANTSSGLTGRHRLSGGGADLGTYRGDGHRDCAAGGAELADAGAGASGRAIWSGFLVTSALAGSEFVLMLTLVGVFLLPVMLVLTILAIFAGYALGSYVLGVGLWLAAGRAIPEGLPGKFALACLGAFLAGLAWLVPIAGWFFVLGLTMLGIGTLAAFALPGGWLLRREAVQP